MSRQLGGSVGFLGPGHVGQGARLMGECVVGGEASIVVS